MIFICLLNKGIVMILLCCLLLVHNVLTQFTLLMLIFFLHHDDNSMLLYVVSVFLIYLFAFLCSWFSDTLYMAPLDFCCWISGWQVRLEKKVAIHNGIICLNPKVITVLGGVVQSLYEEWQMNKKYSGFSRSSLRISQESGTGSPPPFEKLKIGVLSSRSSNQGRISC